MLRRGQRKREAELGWFETIVRLTDEHVRRSREWSREIEARGGSRVRSAWVELDRLDGRPKPYVPDYVFGGEWINQSHRDIAQAPLGRLSVPFLLDIGVDGFLHRAEGLKLYELAFYSPGDVLELGTHKGLSTTILARALHDKGSGFIETVDIDAETNPEAQRNVLERPGGERVSFTLKDATARLNELAEQSRRFGFIFVDHWHGYEATLEAAERVKRMLVPGAFIMFHDFFDPANTDPDHVYGVYQGVLDGFGDNSSVRFIGSAGGSAIFS